MSRPALVLAAGLGTRLRPLTLVRAKPAIPVAGIPLIRRIAAWLASRGVHDLVVNLHHLPHTVSGVLGDGSDLDVRVRYSWEQPVVLGSAGGPRHALPLIEADEFFIVNGDTLTDLDLVALADSHRTSGALVTLALVANREPERYGGVILDEDHRVRGFVPRGTAARDSYHFIGVQLADRRVFEALPDNTAVNTLGDVYDRLIAANPGAIHGFVSGAMFHDIGTASDYWATSLAFQNLVGPTTLGRHTLVHPSARIERSIIWDDVEIGPDAILEHCIVTDGVRVRGRTSYRGVILLRDDRGEVTTAPLPDSTASV